MWLDYTNFVRYLRRHSHRIKHLRFDVCEKHTTVLVYGLWCVNTIHLRNYREAP